MLETATGTSTQTSPSFQIPKKCKAGVVVNEGPDFRVVRLPLYNRLNVWLDD